MDVSKANIPGVLIFQPTYFGDDRGYFLETFNEARYRSLGLNVRFVQDNLSHSAKGVLRGLHYQVKHPQGKLVSVIQGQVLDVMVDLRLGSPTFGQSFSLLLDGNKHNQIYVPPGLAHGFSVLSETATFSYKCTDFYYPEDEAGVLWSDPELAVDWGLDIKPQLSEKDKRHPLLCEINEGQLFRFDG